MNNLAEADGFTTAVGNVQNLLQKKKEIGKVGSGWRSVFFKLSVKQEAGVQGRLAR